MTDTAVIVVSYNTRELTLQAVAAASKASAGLDARVLVADIGSTEGTAEAVRAADPEVAVLVNADNPGYGAAVNRAAAALPSTHVCAMNADVVLEPGDRGHVLDADGQAREQTHLLAAHQPQLQVAGVVERPGIERDDGVDGGVVALDARQARLDDLDGRDFARPDEPRELGGGAIR